MEHSLHARKPLNSLGTESIDILFERQTAPTSDEALISIFTIDTIPTIAYTNTVGKVSVIQE